MCLLEHFLLVLWSFTFGDNFLIKGFIDTEDKLCHLTRIPDEPVNKTPDLCSAAEDMQSSVTEPPIRLVPY